MPRRRNHHLRKLTRTDRLARSVRNERRGRTDRVVWNGQSRVVTPSSTRRASDWYRAAKRRLEAL